MPYRDMSTCSSCKANTRAAREEAIAALEKGLRAQASAITLKETSARERDADLAGQQRRLEEREGGCATQEQDLIRREAIIAEQAEEKDSKIECFEGQIERLRIDHKNDIRTLEQKHDQDLQVLHSKIKQEDERKQEKITELERSLSMKDRVIIDLRNEIQQKERVLEDSEKDKERIRGLRSAVCPENVDLRDLFTDLGYDVPRSDHTVLRNNHRPNDFHDPPPQQPLQLRHQLLWCSHTLHGLFQIARASHVGEQQNSLPAGPTGGPTGHGACSRARRLGSGV